MNEFQRLLLKAKKILETNNLFSFFKCKVMMKGSVLKVLKLLGRLSVYCISLFPVLGFFERIVLLI